MVVIRFDGDVLARLEVLDQFLRPTSQVRHYCGSMALVAGDECNIVRSTVWHGDREQGEIHHIDEIQGIEDLRTLFTQHPDLTERALVGMDRRSPSAMGTSRSTSMVTVMMRDEDGIEILRRAAGGGEAPLELPAREPLVDEHCRLIGCDERGVSATPCSKVGHFHRHVLVILPSIEELSCSDGIFVGGSATGCGRSSERCSTILISIRMEFNPLE